MNSGLLVVVFLAWMVAAFILYHKVFNVIYFSLGRALLNELFGCFIVAAIMTALTFWIWPLVVVLIIIAGVSIAQKTGKKSFIIGAIILAIAFGITGHNIKKQINENSEMAEQMEAQNEIDEIETYIVNFYYPEDLPGYEGALICYTDVIDGEDAVDPSDTLGEIEGYNFVGWDKSLSNIHSDLDVHAIYEMSEEEEESISEDEELIQADDSDTPIGDFGYILPTSDSEYLDINDLEGLTKEGCRLARNEIYARHGRIFDSEDLQSYFEDRIWYQPLYTKDEFDEGCLNEYEVANRDLIVAYEKQLDE